MVHLHYINTHTKHVQVSLSKIKKAFSLKAIIRRPYKIEVSYITQDGEYIKKQIQDFEARIFYHEFDHLNGKTFDNLDLTIDHIQTLGEEKSISLEV